MNNEEIIRSLHESLDKIQSKIHIFQDELNQSTPGSKEYNKAKSGIRKLETMKKDIYEQIHHFEPKKKKTKKNPEYMHIPFSIDHSTRQSTINIDSAKKIDDPFAADSDGMLLSMMEESNSNPEVAEWIDNACKTLTEKQALYMDLYFNEAWTMPMIAEKYNINRCTVSRTLERAKTNMQRYILTQVLIKECIMDDNTFDYYKFILENQLMTDRQKQVSVLLLAGFSKSEIAVKLKVDKSVMSHTVDKIERVLSPFPVPKDMKIYRFPPIDDLENFSIQGLSQVCGPNIWMLYTFGFPKEKFDGKCKMHYEVMKLFHEGKSPKEISDEIHVAKRTARNIISRYREGETNDST